MDLMLPQQKLDCYRLALGVATWAAEVRVPSARKHLRDQLVRAADSVLLNIAEGCGHKGDARRNFNRIALGSASEVAAILDLLQAPAERRTEVVRICQMLGKMSR